MEDVPLIRSPDWEPVEMNRAIVARHKRTGEIVRGPEVNIVLAGGPQNRIENLCRVEPHLQDEGSRAYLAGQVRWTLDRVPQADEATRKKALALLAKLPAPRNPART